MSQFYDPQVRGIYDVIGNKMLYPCLRTLLQLGAKDMCIGVNNQILQKELKKEEQLGIKCSDKIQVLSE
jgi:hypothetical protein